MTHPSHTPLRALTLTQPWASLMAAGAKRIETRSWPTAYRGPVAIHAAKRFPPEARALCAYEPFHRALAGAAADDLPRGAIVAVGTLVEVVSTTDLDWRQMQAVVCASDDPPDAFLREFIFGNYMPGRYAWLFKNVVALPEPVVCPGRLGMWAVPETVGIHVTARLLIAVAAMAERSAAET